jgi:hypothetical protein
VSPVHHLVGRQAMSYVLSVTLVGTSARRTCKPADRHLLRLGIGLGCAGPEQDALAPALGQHLLK